MQFTPRQQAAIATSGDALLVSAAAGAGKTAVLVERVIRLICDEQNPIDIDKLLIVTFTNAAAAEMRQRIAKALRNRLRNDPQNPLLLHQLLCLRRAQICTIHAACKKLMDQNFSVLGIDPSVGIGEEIDMALLLEATTDEFMETLYQRRHTDASIEQVLQFFATGRDDTTLREALTEVRKYIVAQPFPQQAIQTILPKVGRDIFDCFWDDSLYQTVAEQLQWIGENLQQMISHCQSPALVDTCLSEYYENVYRIVLQIDSAWRARDFDGAYSIFERETIGAHPRGNSKQFAQCIEQYQQLKTQWDTVYNSIKTLRSQIFNQPQSGHMEDMRLLRQVLNCLFSLAGELEQRYEQQKKQKNVVSFSDLERYALQLLVEKYDEKTGEVVVTDFARRIANERAEIIVDEYQDCNRLQEMIFYALSKGGRNLFMVGDVKQSIYRFRDACPALFLDRLASSETVENATVLQAPGKLFLNQNFRSHPQILTAVNQLFCKIMSPALGQVCYDADQMLYPSDLYPQDSEATTELHLILRPNEEQMEDGEFALLQSLEQEASFVVNRIQKMVEDKETVFDVKTQSVRPIQYGDIAILTRSAQHVTSFFERELIRRGIGCINKNQDDSFLDSWEIQMVLSYLQVINNPYLDIPLITLLYSDFYNISAKTLAQIRAVGKHQSFFDAVRTYSQTDTKMAMFVSSLDRLRRASVGAHTWEILENIYRETGILQRVAGYPDGHIRTANMELLLQYARDYEKNSYKGLFSFLHYIERMIEHQKILPAAQAGQEQGSCVQIMTIHKSKGLEFPICFVVNLSRTIQALNTKKTLVITNRVCGCKITDPKAYTEHTPLVKVLADISERDEEYSEAERLLYVAMTRAKTRLYLVSAVEKDELEKVMAQAQKISPDHPVPISILKQQPSFLHWLLYGWHDQRGLESVYQACNLEPLSYCDGPLKAFIHPAQKGSQRVKERKEQGIERQALDQLTALLTAEYAHQEETKIPIKMSVSEVKGMRQPIPEAVELLAPKSYHKKPRFISQDRVGGSAKGNAVHKFLQFADFHTLAKDGGFAQERQRLLAQNFFSAAEMDLVEETYLRRFTEHDIFEQLLKAKQLLKEQRFMFSMPACDLISGVRSQREILLQGVLDCLYQTQDGWVVLDYKTDRLADEASFLQRYEIQLQLYGYAVQQYWGIEVQRLLIYSFALNKLIEIEPKKTLAF